MLLVSYCILTIVYFYKAITVHSFFPESIRWLIVMDKPEQATAIIKRAAKWNGVEVPDNILLHESVRRNRFLIVLNKELDFAEVH